MAMRRELLPPAWSGAAAPPPAYAPEAYGDAEETSWFREGLRVLRERRRSLLLVLGLGAAAVIAYLVLVPEQRLFEARAQMVVEPESAHPLDYASAAAPIGPEGSYYETQYRVLRSRTLARRTLVAMTASASSAAGAGTANASPASASPASASLAGSSLAGSSLAAAGTTATGTLAAPPPPAGAASLTAPTSAASDASAAATASASAAADALPSSAVDAFLRGLSIVHIPDSRLVEVRFTSDDPAYAARAVNAHTQSYIRQSVELTLLASRQAAKWLDREIEDERLRVESGEAALDRYRKNEGALEERQTMVSQRLSELNGAVLRARAERTTKELAYQQVDEARRAGRAPRELAALVPNPMIQSLSIDLAGLQRREVELATNYGERHPERVKVREAIRFTEARLDAEVTRAIDAMRRDVVAARQEEGRMAGALEAQTSQSSSLSRKAVDYEALKRDLSNDRAMFEKLQQRARELRLTSDYELSNIRVIDPAEVPRSPLPDTRWRNATMGAGASFVLAFLVAFGLHYMDERLRSPEDIKTHLGLPYLGMVPKLAAASLESGPTATIDRPPPPFTEALRDLRTHVLCTPAGRASRILLVASAGMDEGKTLVATQLAVGLAQVGYRVLLIDLDLRKPSVHSTFGVPLQPGLSELLSSGAAASESIHATSLRDLWILTAGRPRGNPGDLLGSIAFQRLMRNLPESFDRIIVDSPPVMAVTDASLVAHEQVGVVFVVSADRTGRRAAQAALERLEAVGARFVGAVLNRVDLRREGSVHYQQYDDDYDEYEETTARDVTVKAAPSQTANAQTASAQTLGVQTVGVQTVGVQTASAQTVSVQTVVGQSVTGQSVTGQRVGGQGASGRPS